MSGVNNIWFLLIFILKSVVCQECISDSCFDYEAFTSYEFNNIYGKLRLQSTCHYHGIWIALTFNKPLLEFGTWFGEGETINGKEHLIKNWNFNLLPNQTLNIEFSHKFNPRGGAPPILIGVELNGLQVTTCSERKKSKSQIPIMNFNFPTTSTVGQLQSFSQNDSSTTNGLFPSAVTNCGTVVKSANEFPWHGVIYRIGHFSLSYICGTSLISELHLLTTAHCVTKVKNNTQTSPHHLLVFLGRLNLSSWDTSQIQTAYIKKIIIHPNYDPLKLKNNIAVLKMTKPVEFNNYVRPICLWEGDPNLNLFGINGTVVGFGFHRNGDSIDHSIKTIVSIVSDKECKGAFFSSNTFCGKFMDGSFDCNGDLGTEMVLPTIGTSAANPVWQLRGLVSSNTAFPSLSAGCGDQYYVIFTDVAQHVNWIKTNKNMK